MPCTSINACPSSKNMDNTPEHRIYVETVKIKIGSLKRAYI